LLEGRTTSGIGVPHAVSATKLGGMLEEIARNWKISEESGVPEEIGRKGLETGGCMKAKATSRKGLMSDSTSTKQGTK
jgi:hypothetical protein